MAALTSYLRTKVVPLTDRRVTQMNEIVNSIRLIKMYAWESSFVDRVLRVRRAEVAKLRLTALVQSLSLSISPSITIMAAIVTFFALT